MRWFEFHEFWSLIQAKSYREARNSEPENVEDDDVGKILNSWMSSHTTLWICCMYCVYSRFAENLLEVSIIKFSSYIVYVKNW